MVLTFNEEVRTISPFTTNSTLDAGFNTKLPCASFTKIRKNLSGGFLPNSERVSSCTISSGVITGDCTTGVVVGVELSTGAEGCTGATEPMTMVGTGSTVNARSIFTNGSGGVVGDAWITSMRVVACVVVILEKAVMSGTNALAGVVGEDFTTDTRLFAWSRVRGAANMELGNISRPIRNGVYFI